jgi:hypothetical protein
MAQDALHGHRGPTAMSGLHGRCGLPRVGGREYGVRGLWVVETIVLGLSCPTASSYPRLLQTGQEQSAPSRRPCGVGPGRHCLGTAPATPETVPVAARTSRCPGVEGGLDGPHLRHLVAHIFLGGLHTAQPPVDVAGQTCESLMRRPPFWASRFRWRDARTSPRASAMRMPGGCSGPP